MIMDLGMAPIEKNSNLSLSATKGMTPIAKNIRVVDASNHEYEPTYPKRAKGLVKNGRAYFVDQTTICLTSPLNIQMEDYAMSEHTDQNEKLPIHENAAASTKYSIDYILEQLERITAQSEHLSKALDVLGAMDDGHNAEPYSPGNTIGPAKAAAIGETVRSREATNQQIIRLYEKMYDDLKTMK